jgi:PST family polysaccharide transporter
MNTATAHVAREAGTAARWAVVQNAAKQAIDLIVFLVLARLLAPQAFGLVATVMAVIVVLSVLVELGIGDALVRHRILEERHTRSAFSLVLLTGVTLTAALGAAAPWLARLHGQEPLAPLLAALSPLVLVHALNVVPQALLQRRLAGRPLALRSLWGTLCGAAAGLALAAGGAGVWSLAAQQLTAALVSLGLLWHWSGWRPRVDWDRAAAGELLAFSRHVLATRALNVLSSKADVMVVGAVAGPVALGLYSVAARLQLALEQVFSQGIDLVALSAFSRAADDRRQVGQLHLLATQRAASIALPFFTASILAVPDALALAIGERWAGAVPVLQILLAAAMLHTLMHFNHGVFKACGRPEWSSRLALCSTALTAIGLALSAAHGIAAVALAYFLRAALLAPVGFEMAARLTGCSSICHLRAWSAPAARAAAIATLIALVWTWAPWSGGSLGGEPAAALWRLATIAAAITLVEGANLWVRRLPRRLRLAPLQ